MSQGDTWQLPDGRKGLEVRRNEKELLLSVIRDDWPWPDYPIWVNKAQCRKLPTRYHHNELVEDALV
jgi:hypothetical protein